MLKLKLIHSVKSLHEALTSLNTACIQDAKTHSFRESDQQQQHHPGLNLYDPDDGSTQQQPPVPEASSSEPVPSELHLTSRRLFFTPRTTKSIMEELKTEASQRPSICEESVQVVVASDDPYRDFRTSMEEMVVAHGLREWPQLLELLHCYLSLNDRKAHSIIALAFVDVLMCVIAKDKDDLFTSFPSSSVCPVEALRTMIKSLMCRVY